MGVECEETTAVAPAECLREASSLATDITAAILAFLVTAGIVCLLLSGFRGCHDVVPRKVLTASEASLPSLGRLSDAPAPVCTRLDCPPYAAVHRGTDFEIRAYRDSVWVETGPLMEASFNKAGVIGFHRLFQYIQGRNVEGAHIPMTAPVLTSIKRSSGPFASPTFAVKFLVPLAFAKHPPKPSPGVDASVVDVPRRCVAVRTFPGFATDLNIGQEAKKLSDSLHGTPWANITHADVTTSEAYSIAQYNSPIELFNRVNEVWVPFQGGVDCAPLAYISAAFGEVLE